MSEKQHSRMSKNLFSKINKIAKSYLAKGHIHIMTAGLGFEPSTWTLKKIHFPSVPQDIIKMT